VCTPDLRHDLFVYDADELLAVHVERYLAAGLELDERVLLVVDARKQTIMRDALGADAELVAFVEQTDVYTRPEGAMAAYDAAVREMTETSDQGVRVYGELPACRTTAEWEAWIAYEAIVNRAFAGRPVTVMCGYDARVVPEPIIRQAWRAHRVVLTDAWQISHAYEEPEEVVRSLTPVVEPLAGLRSLEIGGRLQPQDRLADELGRSSLWGSRTRDLMVAAREVLSNAERYGRGVRALRVGHVGNQLVCEVTDGGPGIDDPLAGYVPPRPLTGDGAGLWIARQLTSRLELLSLPDGFTVRLWV
jgi:anti-sigma regulatory factor (Ser/Thr protein kinase)